MGRIDPMYQFSLDAYIELFCNSIDKSLKHPRLEERIQYLNDYHTYAVYKYTCRGLFEKHKLLFSFQMCAKILEAAGKLNLDEYNFFLRGGVVSVCVCVCVCEGGWLWGGGKVLVSLWFSWTKTAPRYLYATKLQLSLEWRMLF